MHLDRGMNATGIVQAFRQLQFCAEGVESIVGPFEYGKPFLDEYGDMTLSP